MLIFSKCSRVRSPHPPGNIYLDPIFEYSGKKKTLSGIANLSQKLAFFCQTINIF